MDRVTRSTKQRGSVRGSVAWGPFRGAVDSDVRAAGGTPLPFLVRQRLKGPAIAVRVGEGRVGDCGLAGRGYVLDPPTSTPRLISSLRAAWMLSTTRCRPWIEPAVVSGHPDADGDGAS